MWLAVQYSVTAAKLTPAILLLTSMVVTAQSYTNLLGILWNHLFHSFTVRCTSYVDNGWFIAHVTTTGVEYMCRKKQKKKKKKKKKNYIIQLVSAISATVNPSIVSGG